MKLSREKNPSLYPNREPGQKGLPRPWLKRRDGQSEHVFVQIIAKGTSATEEVFNYNNPTRFNLDSKGGRQRAALRLATFAVEWGRDMAVGPAINIDKTVKKGAPQTLSRADIYGLYVRNRLAPDGYTAPKGEEKEQLLQTKYEEALASLPRPLGSRLARIKRAIVRNVGIKFY